MSCDSKAINMHWHWTTLEGIKGYYEGSDADSLAFKFGGIVWCIIKDDLGYSRSLLDFVVYGDQNSKFNEVLKENVRLEKVVEISTLPFNKYEVFSGWVLKSIEDDHVWLLIGTDYSSVNYPHAIFEHFSKSNR